MDLIDKPGIQARRAASVGFVFRFNAQCGIFVNMDMQQSLLAGGYADAAISLYCCVERRKRRGTQASGYRRKGSDGLASRAASLVALS